MYISFNEQNSVFTLTTKNTAYAMKIEHGKYLTHVYYGDVAKDPSSEKAPGYLSFSPYYEEENGVYTPDTSMAEFPQFGSGDYRSSAIKVSNSNGDSVTLFAYKSHEVLEGRVDIPGMPNASAAEASETLAITLEDELTHCEVTLYYTVYPEEDVISRYFKVKNGGEAPVTLERAMSLALDIPRCDLDLISFPGHHVMERKVERTSLRHSRFTMESRRGATSHQMNNSFILADSDADENKGQAIAFSYVYSGSFMNTVEVDPANVTRVLVGMHPDCFSWRLEKGEEFASPEAVMTLSVKGIGQVSRNLHRFARKYIVRPCPLEKRPVVLNTWEGNFFNIDEETMVEFATEAKACGMDMLVMDDGWFGKRYDDTAGLGDWQANPERFKNGLSAFVKRIKALGINFGIWIEPEMVNPDSDLYRAHPEWLLCAPGRRPTLSRHQALLDFANPEVIEYLKRTFKETFTDVPIDYIKWDFNRHLSEVSSAYLPVERRGETSHRFMLGVYELYEWFCETYPNVMIENCSGGGGRYDLAMMKYSSQIWTSDNTDPEDRIMIQYGSSMCYPACVMSCHVSDHNGSVEDPKETDFRWKVAMQGMLGYEFDIRKLSQNAKDIIKTQIEDYRKYQNVIENGELYRLISPYEDGKSAFYYMTEDENEIIVFFYQIKGEKPKEYRLKINVPKGSVWSATLNGGAPYRDFELNTGLIVRSSAEDHYSTMFHFVRDRKSEKK